MNLGTATTIRADARLLPLADNTVDLVVTSPPYFALRSYQDNGQHYTGQLGSEPTPQRFVDALLDVTDECVRVLKPSGSLWVNLGDKYAGGGMGGHSAGLVGTRPQGEGNTYRRAKVDVAAKSLIGIPWRYALACIDTLGLILRAEVIWSKPNGLPESVTDRVRRSHEQWFHFTLQPRYFSAVDEIRETFKPDIGSTPKTWDERKADGVTWTPGHGTRGTHLGKESAQDSRKVANPLGKLPGSVWTIPTEPLRVPDHLGIDHFAAFPTEWPRRIIQGWSPAGVCVECGEGRRPVVNAEDDDRPRYRTEGVGDRPQGGARLAKVLRADGTGGDLATKRKTITGYACACPAPTSDTTPAIVLDPFGGTGTTALVAKALGRHGISIDKSHDYSRLARWRTNNRNQLAKILNLPKQATPDPAQLALFDDNP